MRISWLQTTLVLFFVSGCAERAIDISDQQGKIVGNCIAGYDWHFYGLADSIDYMLYQCAKDAIAKGLTISDPRLLTLDFTLPQPPEGKSWNKKLALSAFHNGKITETELGYILAEIEYQYQQLIWQAENQLASGKITKAEFNQVIKNAKFTWLGS